MLSGADAIMLVSFDDDLQQNCRRLYTIFISSLIILQARSLFILLCPERSSVPLQEAHTEIPGARLPEAGGILSIRRDFRHGG